MNKFLIIILFLIGFNLEAQDSIPKSEKIKTYFTEKNIIVDSDSIQSKKFPNSFKKKYADTDFIYEFKAPEKNAWDRFKEWLANILKNLFSFSSNEASLSAAEILLKGLAIAIVIFVIYLIVKSVMNKEGQWIFGRNSDKKIINYTEIEKNLQLVDFEKLIKNTLKSGEKRLSIRYYYLWLLKKMSNKEIIVWDIEKTNSDYFHEIKNQETKDNFAYLSYLYNYIWYGEFDLDDETFEKAKAAFEKSIKSLGNE